MSDSPRDHNRPSGTALSSLGRVRQAARRGSPLDRGRRVGKHADGGHELSLAGGLAALSLDALSSVAYGPEAMALVLVSAGSGALRFTVPLTLVITGMLGCW